MKKTTKVLTTAVSLLAFITGNSVAKATTEFDNVRETVQQVQALANQGDQTSAPLLFEKLSLLTKKIEQLNASLIYNKFKLSLERFAFLQAIRDLLDLNSAILLDKHEERIMREFRSEYRAYTNSIVELDYSIARIKEKLNLTQVADLNLSALELEQINQSAKARAIK